MSSFGSEVALWKIRMNEAIASAMQNEVADAFKKAIVRSAQERVYDAYEPEFYSRGINDNSIIDEDALLVNATDAEITIEQQTPFQQLWGGERPASRLVDAIESGDPRFNMGKAGARKFMEPAKEDFIKSGEAEAALKQGLQRNGIDTTGMTFDFS